MTTFIIQNAAANSGISRILMRADQGGINIQTTRIGLIIPGFDGNLTRHFGDIFGTNLRFAMAWAQFQGFFDCGSELFCTDVVKILHASQDILLPQGGTLGVAHRVDARRRLGQSGQHCSLGDAQILHCLTIVRLSRLGKAIGTLAEEYLIHVDLKNLVFAHIGLNLESQQHFVYFSGQCTFAR